MSSKSIVSVITVHFQDYARLQFTWKSIQPWLRCREIEWIVIDGKSMPFTPSDRALLSRVEQAAGRFISEPDSGVYDAMNKGVRLATGKYFLFLNAGDRFSVQFSPAKLLEKAKESTADMIWGNTSYQYADGSFAVKKLRPPKWMIYGMPVCHQSVLFLRASFGNMPYNLDYGIAADYELLARALKSGASTLLIEDIISEYSAGGLSQIDQRLSLSEESRVRCEHYGVPVLLSKMLAFLKLGLWKLSDFSPRLNKAWRKAL